MWYSDGYFNTNLHFECLKEAKTIDMILGKCELQNRSNSLYSITYVIGNHWNCIKEAIPMYTYNICFFNNRFSVNIFYLYILYIEQHKKAYNNIRYGIQKVFRLM